MKKKIPHQHDSEVWGTTEFIAIYKDPDGIPRAWGIGSNKDLAGRAALIELEEYREGKRALGDPLGRATFTCEILPYCDSCGGPVHSKNHHHSEVGA